MAVIQLIYRSQPFGFDDAMLDGILLQARRNNPARGITGALITRADLYLQLLEGPAEAVLPMYDRIARDSRHLAVTRISAADVAERLFPGWAMRDDPADSWLGSSDQIERATPAAVLAIFAALAARDCAAAQLV